MAAAAGGHGGRVGRVTGQEQLPARLDQRRVGEDLPACHLVARVEAHDLRVLVAGPEVALRDRPQAISRPHRDQAARVRRGYLQRICLSVRRLRVGVGLGCRMRCRRLQVEILRGGHERHLLRLIAGAGRVVLKSHGSDRRGQGDGGRGSKGQRSQRDEMRRRALHAAQAQVRSATAARGGLDLGQHADGERQPGQPRAVPDHRNEQAAVIATGQHHADLVPVGQPGRQGRPAELIQHDRQSDDRCHQGSERRQAGQGCPRASDHAPPVTPVTSCAVAVRVVLKLPMPISDRNLVGSVMVTRTVMARLPSGLTVKLR